MVASEPNETLSANRRSAGCCTQGLLHPSCASCKNRNQHRCRSPIWVASAPDGTLSPRRRQHEAPYGRPSPSNSDRIMESTSARKTKKKAATNGSVPTCCSKQCHEPTPNAFSQFGKSFQNSTCGTMGHGRNSNPDDTQLLGVC